MNLIIRLKWWLNYKNIRQRYANYCKRMTEAKDGDMVSVDWDVMKIQMWRQRTGYTPAQRRALEKIR